MEQAGAADSLLNAAITQHSSIQAMDSIEEYLLDHIPHCTNQSLKQFTAPGV